MAIYLDYDQAALDAQYNNGARVADSPSFRERWRTTSAAARDAGPARIGVSYGEHPRQVMDIFAGAGKDAPTLVFIHGGYWHMMVDVSSYSYPAPVFNAAGMNYVALQYRLVPEVKIADIVADIRDGLAFLWRGANGYGLDPARLTIAGHSAGGHLTALAMATDWQALGSDLPDDLVKGGTAISGLYDLEPIRLSYLNEVLGLEVGDVASLSPMNHLAPRALNAVVGGEESDEFLRQTAEFHAAWTGGGGTGAHVITQGDNHFSIIDGLAHPDSALFQAIQTMCADG